MLNQEELSVSVNELWKAIVELRESIGDIKKTQDLLLVKDGESSETLEGGQTVYQFDAVKTNSIESTSGRFGSIRASNAEVSNNLSVGGDLSVSGKSSFGSVSASDMETTNLKSQTIDNSGAVTTRDLVVTGSAYFDKIIINELEHRQGSLILSAANGIVRRVDGSKIYFDAVNSDGVAVENRFKVGDYILCESFIPTSGVSVSNVYYFAEVESVGQEVISDNQYNYISYINKTGASNPSIGDEVVQFGSKTDAERANVIIISAFTPNLVRSLNIQGPMILQLKNVSSPTLSEQNIVSLVSRTRNVFNGSFVSQSLGDVDAVLSSIRQSANSIEARVSNLESSGGVSISADQILLQIQDKLKTTGINLKSGIITLNADKTIVNGNLAVSKLETATKNSGLPYITVEDDTFLISYGDGGKGIEASIGDDGNLHLIFYDRQGRPSYDLGSSGLLQIQTSLRSESWETKEGFSIDKSSPVSTFIQKCLSGNLSRLTYHVFTAKYDFITKTYPNGDGEKDGQCFTSMDKNSIELPDGWYTLNASGPFRLAYEHPDGREIYSLLLVRIPFGEHPEYLKLTFDNQGRVYRLSADGKTPTEITASTVQEWIEKS